MRSVVCLLTGLWMVAASATGACGTEKLTLMLDWFPNVDHLPIYVARERGDLERAGLELAIVSPSETADALRLAASGKVDLAVSYQPQTVIAAAEGLPVRVVGRLVAHPLTCLMFLEKSGIKHPSDLSGKRIGYTVPGLMDVLLAAFAAINHIEDYQAIHVGFAIVPSLAAGKVDAVMGPFKTYETVTMARHGHSAGFFALERWGIPDYDELVFVAGAGVWEKRPAALAAFRSAVARGIAFARDRPRRALEIYLAAVPEADPAVESEAFELTRPHFARSQKLDPDRWRRFADFALRHGLIEKAVDVGPLLAGP